MALAKAVLPVVLEIPISWPASSRYSPLEKLWRMRRCFWRAGRRNWSFDWQCFGRMVFLVDERVRCVSELPIGKGYASAKRRNSVVRMAGKPSKQVY